MTKRSSWRSFTACGWQRLELRHQIMLWPAKCERFHEQGASLGAPSGGDRPAGLWRCGARQPASAPSARPGCGTRPTPAYRSPASSASSPIGCNLRQGPGTEYPGRLGVPARRPARRGHPASSTAGGRCATRKAPPAGCWTRRSAAGARRWCCRWEVKTGQEQPESVPLRDDDSESAAAVAQVEAGVLASIIDCNGRWCRDLGRRLSRLRRADQALGRLPGRGHQVARRPARSRRQPLLADQPHHHVDVGDLEVLPAAPAGRRRGSKLPGMSISLPSASTKK